MTALPLIGSQLDRYRLSRLVADHGSSGAYLADDLALNRTVRLTAVAVGEGDTPGVHALLCRVAAFEHQHALSLYDAGVEGGVAYLVHPAVQYASLADVVRARRRLDADDLLVLALQIASALDAAHTAGLSHGQLTADRVLLPPRSAGWYAVIDGMGVAMVEAAGASARAGQLPPPVDVSAGPDVAALGRLLFFGLVGRAMAGAAHPDYGHLGASTGSDRAADARRDLPPAIDDVLAGSQQMAPPVYADCGALVRAARDVLRGANRHTVIQA
jgi:serine/threonine protein kinase